MTLCCTKMQNKKGKSKSKFNKMQISWTFYRPSSGVEGGDLWLQKSQVCKGSLPATCREQVACRSLGQRFLSRQRKLGYKLGPLTEPARALAQEEDALRPCHRAPLWSRTALGSSGLSSARLFICNNIFMVKKGPSLHPWLTLCLTLYENFSVLYNVSRS